MTKRSGTMQGATSAVDLTEVRDLLERPGVISLAADLPAPELFPMSSVAEVTTRLRMRDAGPGEFGVPYQPLKEKIVDLMALRGLRCRADQIVLTTGTQQGLELLSRLLAFPEREILLEETVYDGIHRAIAGQDLDILPVGTDADTGIDLEKVAALLESGHRPAFLYVIPEGHNPLGVSLAFEKRLQLAELARRFRVPILEDDAYGYLSYDGNTEPPLRALEEQWVFYLGTFSTILAPALRAGWILLPDARSPCLAGFPNFCDLDTPSFSQRTISEYIEAGFLPEHLEAIRAAYRRRRDIMVRSLQEHFSQDLRWSRPSSGLFVWVEIPPSIEATALLKMAVEMEGVSFTPGVLFGGASRHAFRLSFGNNSPQRIEEGVRRLGRLLKSLLN